MIFFYIYFSVLVPDINGNGSLTSSLFIRTNPSSIVEPWRETSDTVLSLSIPLRFASRDKNRNSEIQGKVYCLPFTQSTVFYSWSPFSFWEWRKRMIRLMVFFHLILLSLFNPFPRVKLRRVRSKNVLSLFIFLILMPREEKDKMVEKEYIFVRLSFKCVSWS